MPNKVKYGLKNVHAALITEAEDGSISFAKPQPIKGAVSLSLPPVGENTPFYADDVEYFTSIANNGYDGTLEVALVPDWFREEILLEEKDENEVYTENANNQPKQFALLFEFSGDAKKIRHVLYNCKATRPGVEGSTKTNTTEPKTETMNIAARPLPDGRVKARTVETTPDTVYDKWYDSVYGADTTAQASAEEQA